MKRYNRDVLIHTDFCIYGKDLEAFALKPKDGFIDIHIIDRKYQVNESNTLKLQEEEAHISGVTEKFLLEELFRHIIWDSLYGRDDKLWSVDLKLSHEEL